ncbi:hypothetical protein B0H67DRAFT_547609 [Lasiosphaeris hirsuta]|uniref:Uncharacterized protein n=1 Tax=Lasiosphaeris hirsuta TaxID=260670 RepID=A0AA40E750_9PEZI|nr:hypothetical protein B0H67DRAFT_547609 [Lasiosphaeris hirsuta]
MSPKITPAIVAVELHPPEYYEDKDAIFDDDDLGTDLNWKIAKLPSGLLTSAREDLISGINGHISTSHPYGIFPCGEVMVAMLRNLAKSYALTLTHNIVTNGPTAAALPARLGSATPVRNPVNMFGSHLTNTPMLDLSIPSTPGTHSSPGNLRSAVTAPNPTPKRAPPSARKTTTGKMEDELKARQEGEFSTPTDTTYYIELTRNWKCDQGAKCKNYRASQGFIFCYMEDGSSYH